MKTPATQPIEQHPLGFFLPENTKLLMLGSFPPPRACTLVDEFLLSEYPKRHVADTRTGFL